MTSARSFCVCVCVRVCVCWEVYRTWFFQFAVSHSTAYFSRARVICSRAVANTCTQPTETQAARRVSGAEGVHWHAGTPISQLLVCANGTGAVNTVATGGICRTDATVFSEYDDMDSGTAPFSRTRSRIDAGSVSRIMLTAPSRRGMHVSRRRQFHNTTRHDRSTSAHVPSVY